MAIESYFFNAVESGGVYDRIYNAQDMTDYLNLLVGNGVFPTPSTQLQVRASSGMNVIVGAGSGWINGHKMVNTVDMPLSISASDVLLDRIDAVIFYVDWTARTMGIDVLTGTPASSPVAPTMTRTDSRYEMCLAQITVAKQTTAITASMITDTRGNSNLCGYVAGLIQQLDTTGLFQQFEAGFNDWFDQVKDTLATVTLLQKLEATYTTVGSSESSFDVLNYIPSYNYALDILEVYIDGLRLDENEYGMNQSTVVLVTPITHAGTPITFVVYKSVDGSEAESVIQSVQDIQKVINYTESGMYFATGEDDNIKLSNTVKEFLQQTSKNLLQVTATTQTKNGITFTVNSDGVITVSGTATANTFLSLGTVSLKKGVQYMLSGCPVGGGHAKYRLYWAQTSYYDNGEGVLYTPSADETGTVNLAIYEGMTVNLTFYPMVRLASITDNTWEAYGTSATLDYRQIEIDVYGDLACTDPATITGNTAYWFDFHVQDATRRVRLNFKHCPRIIIDADNSTATTDVFMYTGDTVEVLNMQAVMNNVSDGNMITSDGTGDFIDCAFWLNGKSGASGTLAGAYSGNFTRCRMSVTAYSNVKTYGFSGDGNTLRLMNCEVYAFNPTGSSNESVAVHVQANETTNILIMIACMCPLLTRSGYKQDNVVKVNSGYYSLVANVLGKNPALYSTGTGKTELGSIYTSGGGKTVGTVDGEMLVLG